MLKFILQPLVENAINHGIIPKKNGGSIFLRIWREGDDIMITVEDDGVGFETDGSSIPTGGYALRNIEERLSLYYGPGYGLKISSSPGCGTTAQVRLHMRIPGSAPEKTT